MASVKEELKEIRRELVAVRSQISKGSVQSACLELVTRAISNYDSDEERLEMLRTERDGYIFMNRFSSAAKKILDKIEN